MKGCNTGPVIEVGQKRFLFIKTLRIKENITEPLSTYPED